MTTRLKRKLNDLGVDTASSKANESFCLIGTPLPPLEKSKDTGEFVPLWKQEVRDEKGRRRLHGAFTGGFSAGYFNTVGSKEGWTPSTFVSSRGDRAKQKTAKPEDFMDEEDLAEMRDSQKLVDTTEETDMFGGSRSKAQAEDTEPDSITAALEASLLPPAKDSAGARILRKMGWRLGHGIGPRVTWEQRRRQDAQSSSMNASADDIHAEDEEAKKHMYPPRDTKVPVFPRKDNAHGLGYSPGMGLTQLTAGAGRDVKESSGPNLSAGFGLGALNEAEDDDIDIYEPGSSKGTSRMAYEAEDEGPRVLLGSRTQNKPATRERPQPTVQRASQVFHDGTPVLTGFVLSDRTVKEEYLFPLPDIPEGWAPNPARVWSGKENEGVAEAGPKSSKTQAIDHQTWKRGISADQRGAILGETPLPSAPHSVFDYLAPADRARLQNAKKDATVTALGPAPAPAAPLIHVPRLDPQIAKAAMAGFQPFTADPVKQARYTAFLTARARVGEVGQLGQLGKEDEGEDAGIQPSPGQALDDFNKELVDYAKAAQIFKPITGAMAGRFASAAIVENFDKPVVGLHKPAPGAKPYVDQQKSREEEELKKEESPKESAAKMGMYGPLTREVRAWMPAKLLCKRFGVREPVPAEEEYTPMSTKQQEERKAREVPLAIADTPNADGASEKPGGSGNGNGNGRRDLANIGLGEDETQGRDILTYERPGKDIFKAIFASDDEESDQEDNAEGDAEDHPPVEEAATTSTLVEPEDAKESTTIDVDVPMNEAAPIDLNTFKPTFRVVPRSEREKDKDRDKSEKKDKKKKKKKATLVSFEVEVEDDAGDNLNLKPASASAPGKEKQKEKEREGERPKKVKKKEHRPATRTEVDVDEDDAMWVEKPPPEQVQGLDSLSLTSHTIGDDSVVSQMKGRKRAIDYM